jgi:3-oxoacyl-(acyl-carrier-protein) synthase
MVVYINGIGNISPQLTFGDVPFLKALTEYTDNRLSCIEPDYTGWIEPRAIRRMSRIIRMGVASAGLALKEAGLEKPDAIITGTALGCLEDTGIFLTKMIDNQEQALNPTPFIQSTHNTIGSQVALLLQCLGYNQTYSHRAFSFENALIDAVMMIAEQKVNVLVGGVDELTNISFDVLNRFQLVKQEHISNLKLFESRTPRTVLGEGSAYFLLSADKGPNAYAAISDMTTIYNPEGPLEIDMRVKDFLFKRKLSTRDVDLLILGKNGDQVQDESYDYFSSTLFPDASVAVFKHLCGEYPTATSFAMWMAAKILMRGRVPSTVLRKGNPDKTPKRILIYNQYLGRHHSFIMLESCEL